MTDTRALVLFDCPFLPEFQTLFQNHVRCVFLTELLSKDADEIVTADVQSVLANDISLRSECVAVVSVRHVPFGVELEVLSNLRVVSNHGVGYGHIDAAYLQNRGVSLGFTPQVPSSCTAELGAALILASARNIVTSVRRATSPDTTRFDPDMYGRRVAGATLGIIGFGAMGQALATYMRGFEMEMLYWSRTRKATETVLRVCWCGLDEVLSRSDFVVLCIASSPESRGMMGAEQFRKMKDSATLVNLSRGDIIIQDELVTALESGTIAGAALDVTSPEPLPRDHPLLRMENVLITPHSGSATKGDRRRMAEMCLQNLLAGLRGEALPFPV
uniref:Uncharacterized protein n=1 Tax=Noctiluca scintillans TaxID=2966 RepID=A0A7S1AKI4_NOCSC|mmetsp:Transcript_49754/g.131878  ORF Transcript_49754/g.131878 Transcript_49754/m.131878 type:complete len:331 (+) Transcript_49754:87-1079(+)